MVHTDSKGRTWKIIGRNDGICLYYTKPNAPGCHYVVFDTMDGDEELVTRLHALQIERRFAIAELRSICKAIGDNDWPDELDLSDIIEKHLGDYILERGGIVDQLKDVAGRIRRQLV